LYWFEGPTKIFVFVIGWPSIEAEESFNRMEKPSVPTREKDMTYFNAWLQAILDHADGGWEKRHAPPDWVFTGISERSKNSKKVAWPYQKRHLKGAGITSTRSRGGATP